MKEKLLYDTRSAVMKELIPLVSSNVEDVTADEMMIVILRKMFRLSNDFTDAEVFAECVLPLFSMQDIALMNKLLKVGTDSFRKWKNGKESDLLWLSVKAIFVGWPEYTSDASHQNVESTLRRINGGAV